MIRAIDALQQATFNRVGVPANWKDGEDVLVSSSVSPFGFFYEPPQSYIIMLIATHVNGQQGLFRFEYYCFDRTCSEVTS